VRVPIFVKLVLLLLVFSLLPLGIGAWIVMGRGLHSVERTALQNLQLLAAATASRLDQLIVDTSRTRDILADDQQVVAFCQASDGEREKLAAGVEGIFKRVVKSDPDFASVFVTDRKGIGIASSNPLNVGQDLRFREYIQSAIGGKPFISDLIVGKTTGEAGMYFATPVRASGEVVGTLVIKLSAETVYRICDAIRDRAGHSLEAAISDQDGILLAAPDRSQLYRSFGQLSQEDLKRIAPLTRYGIGTIDSLRLDHLTAYLGSRVPGSASFVDTRTDEVQVLGFAPMQQREWLIWIQQPRSAFDQPLREVRRQSLVAIALVGLVAILVAAMAARRVVRPVQSLEQAARRAAEGDWGARAQVMTRDELGDLAKTFNGMIPQLEEHAHMEQAMELAQRIQQHLLPAHAPRMAGLDVAGLNRPADQTGGDYYDFLDLSEWQGGALAVAVGDVTGHGIPAALLMATARGLLRARATPPGSSAELVGDVNRRLFHDTTEGRFMTLMFAVIERSRRRVRVVSAGHDPILMLNPATGEVRELGGEDLPLAVEENWTFTENVFDDLPDRAVLLIGTDGIWEARNEKEELFGKERITEVLKSCGEKPADQIVKCVMEAVDAFRGKALQKDDITLVVARFV
jgi:serine phosphatase RsbU (regulator of sigma subunit)